MFDALPWRLAASTLWILALLNLAGPGSGEFLLWLIAIGLALGLARGIVRAMQRSFAREVAKNLRDMS